MRFKDKVVLVTGASEGLGLGIAKAFAAEGAQVAVNGRRRALIDAAVERIRAGGGVAYPAPADVSRSDQVRAMVDAIGERHGRIDVLVNNAALTPSDAAGAQARRAYLDLTTTTAPKRSLGVTRAMSDETWLATMAVNLNGVFFCTREALALMEPRGYGKIVNIASIAGISGLSFHSPHYSASKGGVVALTRSVALEVIGAGVNVNCIAAGGVATEGWNTFFEAVGPDVRARLLQLIPAGRIGTIDEFASLALYLASDEAAYLVGQTISPNGGMVT
ncbi:MAG: SDR family oxidoreductase [Rubrivivax sp.]